MPVKLWVSQSCGVMWTNPTTSQMSSPKWGWSNHQKGSKLCEDHLVIEFW